MKRLLTLFLMALALPAWTHADDPMPRADIRAIRDIQSRVYGSPRLASDAPRGEAVLAVAELGSASSSSGNLQSPDYDALFALLQRYRDELLKMGIDSSDLDTQLKNLRVRADELQERLDKLKPKDGLKIHGRVYTDFDDLHVLGAAALNAPGVAPKPAGKGLRFQDGASYSELNMTLTRGPFTGLVEFGVVLPWGLTHGNMSPRKVYFEARLPVVLQVGNVDTSLTPLTLWRNDDTQPFEPEPFASRRQRLLDDLELVPHKWTVTGARASTDFVFFGVQHLQLQDVLSIASNPAGEYSATPPAIYLEANGTSLTSRYTTYMEGWRAALPFWSEHFTLSDNGLLFWDNTSTSPTVPPMTSLNELVQSGRADLSAGIFRADFEYAMSGYTAPQMTYTAAAAAMTGTAMTYSAGIETGDGHIKAFGRVVSNSFHAAGAQGRTQDANYEFLGSFPTENVEIGADGKVGLDPLIPTSFATRFNNVLIPPGTYPANTPAAIPAAWQHLLAYDMTENIDPYGAATPNRQGYGAEGDWKFFKGGIRPRASYEQFNEVDSVMDVTSSPGTVVAPFSMTRLRGGLDFDLKPMLSWPIRIGFGYTMATSSNGANNLTGTAYSLTTTQLDGGLAFDFSDTMGLNAGYRHLDAAGFNETFDVVDGGMAFDLFGFGYWWKPMDNLRFDAVYSQEFISAPSLAGSELEVDEGFLRLTLEF